MLFIALLVSLGLVATGVLPVQQYLERETQVDAAQERLDELTTANDVLADNSAALLTDQEIERIAREQYGYVRDGEIGYVVITPEDGSIPTPAAAPEAAEPPRRSLLQRIVDFITGGDAASDG